MLKHFMCNFEANAENSLQKLNDSYKIHSMFYITFDKIQDIFFTEIENCACRIDIWKLNSLEFTAFSSKITNIMNIIVKIKIQKKNINKISTT